LFNISAPYADTPIRRHADTMVHCGCGYAALWPSVQNLFVLPFSSELKIVAELT
jgi:hypothetical protein